MDAPTLLELMEPISLAETVDQAALLRRLDTKYLVDETTVAALLTQLAPSYRVLDIDDGRSFGYHSRYLDSADLCSFHWHVQQRRRRFKTRIRHYLDSGDRLLEVKARGARGETIKFRTPCAEGQPTSTHAAFVASCLEQAYGMHLDHELMPVLDVSYERTTLVSRRGATRVTLDRALSFRDLASGHEVALPNGFWLVETKSEQGRSDADRALVSAKVRPLSISKYILGLAVTRPELRVNAYVQTLRRLGPLVAAQTLPRPSLIAA